LQNSLLKDRQIDTRELEKEIGKIEMILKSRNNNKMPEVPATLEMQLKAFYSLKTNSNIPSAA
jgi:hypothetical protein